MCPFTTITAKTEHNNKEHDRNMNTQEITGIWQELHRNNAGNEYLFRQRKSSQLKRKILTTECARDHNQIFV